MATELILFTCSHIKKGILENVSAKTTYEAAQKAAVVWRLKSTAGIDVYRQDVSYVLS